MNQGQRGDHRQSLDRSQNMHIMRRGSECMDSDTPSDLQLIIFSF